MNAETEQQNSFALLRETKILKAEGGKRLLAGDRRIADAPSLRNSSNAVSDHAEKMGRIH